MSDIVERSGTVVALDRGRAKIRLEPAAACSGCGSRASCASGAASAAGAPLIRVSLPEQARLGDQVTIEMRASSVAQAALLGYLLPPVSLLLGAIIAGAFHENDSAAVLGAGLGFAAGLLLVRLVSRFASRRWLASAVCQPHSSSGEHS